MNMIHVPVHPDRLKTWSRTRPPSPAHKYDPGYALHMLLSTMFGKSMLQPFRLFHSRERPTATLYGYTGNDPEELRDLAKTVAGPEHLTILDPDQMLWKRMPSGFKSGQLLGFDIKVRPIERLQALKRTPSGELKPVFTERDYFPMYDRHRERRSAARNGNGTAANGNGAVDNGNGPAGNNNGAAGGHPDRNRETDYACWLDHRLARAADVVTCRLAAFYRTAAYRGRRRAVLGPDATLQGTLKINDPDEFRFRVENGVGRHKAYGYGMMLLRPPDTAVAGTA